VADNRNLLQVIEEQREELERWAQSRTLPAGDVSRARLILALADGLSEVLYSGKLSLCVTSILRGIRRCAIRIGWRARELPSEYSLPADVIRLEAGEYGGRVSVSLVPCRIFERQAFLLRTDQSEKGVGHHPRNIIEIDTDGEVSVSVRQVAVASQDLLPVDKTSARGKLRKHPALEKAVAIESPKRVAMRAWCLLLCPVILSADTLILKSGQQVSGAYAGRDPRSIRFAVGDQIKTFTVGDVVQLLFDNREAAGGRRPVDQAPKTQNAVCCRANVARWAMHW
jgi:hypothetical protein